MRLNITAAVERWPVAGQFIIARGAKTYVDVLVVAVSDGAHVGMGEGTAIYYHGESAESCLAQVEGVIDALGGLNVQTARDIGANCTAPRCRSQRAGLRVVGFGGEGGGDAFVATGGASDRSQGVADCFHDLFR